MKGKKPTIQEFINISSKIHKDKYDYSNVEYKNAHTKIEIKCKKCEKVFTCTPSNHLNNKSGCPICSMEKMGLERRIDLKKFIIKANKTHNNAYDYSLITGSVTTTMKLPIICKKCLQTFGQSIGNHINKSKPQGCPFCGCKNRIKKSMLTQAQFEQLSFNIHGNKYDLSKAIYNGMLQKVIIICKKKQHGEFTKSPGNFIYRKQGCPKCKSSRGESLIRRFLEKNNLTFEEQKTFINCKNLLPLPFDFYLPKQNICIEFDGIQHFEPIKRFGGKQQLEKTKQNDEIKNKYCISNNIQLIRIKFNEDVYHMLNQNLHNYIHLCND